MSDPVVDPATGDIIFSDPEQASETQRIWEKAHVLFQELLKRDSELASKIGWHVVIDSGDASAYVVAKDDLEAYLAFEEGYPEEFRKPAGFTIG
jgi:hypothetical protein